MARSYGLLWPTPQAYCEWAPYGSSGDVRYFMAKESPSLEGVAIKGVLPYVPVPPSAIVHLLGLALDDPRKKRLSPDVASMRVLERLDRHTKTVYQLNKALWLVGRSKLLSNLSLSLSKWLLWPTPQGSGTLQLDCYGRHRRAVARSS